MGSLFKESPHLSWSSLQDATPSGDVDLSVVWLIILSAAMTDKEKEAALLELSDVGSGDLCSQSVTATLHHRKSGAGTEVAS